jgi:hypothetical protein
LRFGRDSLCVAVLSAADFKTRSVK